MTGLPWGVWGAGLLLAWRFQRSRTVAAVAALALLERGAGWVPAAHLPGAVDLAAVLLPLVLLVLVLLEDRGLGSPRGAAPLAGVLALGAGAAALVATAPGAPARLLGQSTADPGLALWGGVPEAAALTFAAAATVVTAQAIRRRRPVEEGFLWALVAVILAFTSPPGSPEASAWLVTAGAILALAVVEASHAVAWHDDLTGLPARRALRTALEEAAGLLTVALVDVDHFKRFNDRHGHAVGDQVLRMVAARLDRVGGGGRTYRTGAGEFTLLFPGRRAEEVIPHVTALVEAVAATRFDLRGRNRLPGARGRALRGQGGSGSQDPLSVTISAGVAEGEGGGAGEETVKAAERALHEARGGGRNRVAAGR